MIERYRPLTCCARERRRQNGGKNKIWARDVARGLRICHDDISKSKWGSCCETLISKGALETGIPANIWKNGRKMMPPTPSATISSVAWFKTILPKNGYLAFGRFWCVKVSSPKRRKLRYERLRVLRAVVRRRTELPQRHTVLLPKLAQPDRSVPPPYQNKSIG